MKTITGMNRIIDEENRLSQLQSSLLPDVFEVHTPQNRLYEYFMKQCSQSRQKLQHEKINMNTRLMNNIIETVQYREKGKRIKLRKIQKELEELYQYSHRVYQMLREDQEIDDSQKEEVKRLILIKQKFKEEIQEEIDRLRDEKVNFLRKMLKNGHNRNNGMKWFLQKMIEAKYEPNYSDFPKFMDQKTKQFILNEYKLLKQKKKHQQLPRMNEIPLSKMQRLTKINNHHHLYKETKSYIKDWLNKEGWKNNSFRNIIADEGKEDQVKKQEIQRMRSVYDRVTRKKVMKLMFGESKHHKEGRKSMIINKP